MGTAMNLLEKAELLLHIARWRATWDIRDIDEKPPIAHPKFITARRAAELIPDGATIFSSGMAANARCSIFFWAIKDRFATSAHPRNLTWIVVGAQGGRGRVPGTIEELNAPGLISRFVAGHLETARALLTAADEGRIELHTMAQGMETFLLEAKARGEQSIEHDTALGTFLDPTVGGGSYVGGAPQTMSLIERAGDKLRFTFPRFDVALFVAPYADAEGNIYKRHASTMTEAYESALATRADGGLVIASVADIIPKNEAEIFIPADQVDHIVVNSRSEQTGSIAQRRYWPGFTVEHRDETDVHKVVEKLKFANDILKIAPVRTPIELATARLAASVFMRLARRGALINIGTGLPEEVCRLIYEGGLQDEVTFFTETGVLGGLPAPGIFFGSAVRPQKIITSAQIFHMAYDHLDVTMLGVLEADSHGNVNVSKRGPKMINYVGPGGLPDLVAAARNILFVGSWMAHGDLRVEDGRVRIAKRGEPKFRDAVSQITFNGSEALRLGKTVHYVTNVGVFRLTKRGMMLVEVMPGVDIDRDVVRGCPMKVVLPPKGEVPVVPREIVTGEGFRLAWPVEPPPAKRQGRRLRRDVGGAAGATAV